MLEEGSFRGRTADFVMMFLFGGICMIVSFIALTTVYINDLFCFISLQDGTALRYGQNKHLWSC